MRSVHPHIRGAYAGHGRHTLTSVGSSPHTWGIHGILCERLPDSRFIPTYVGHTRCAKRRWPGGPVHPHIRGAYISPRHSAERLSGSSPHTWGILVNRHLQEIRVRFIPTYVGHTGINIEVHARRPVHPHIRGAYFSLTSPGKSLAGSSPHTWGIRKTQTTGPTNRRFIPTYVGHTQTHMHHRISSTVHPHIRGAYLLMPRASPYMIGSSPHTWGIRTYFESICLFPRFIPTYVGHTEIRRGVFR